MTINSLDVVVGGQFGSEAKGHVTKRVLQRNMLHDFPQADPDKFTNIRVAGPNAGHCVYDDAGNKFALRTIPVGAVFPNVNLVIAPGSEVDPVVLVDEIRMMERAGHRVEGRLSISGEATVLTQAHRDAERGMHERMGSTGKGIGAARADRIMRTARRVMDDPYVQEICRTMGITVYSEPQPFDMSDQHVVIEGTQGYGLGLHAGHYPQCTSSDARAIDFVAMAGLNPWDFTFFSPWVVARVYPIRVAGNSGPLKGETSWEDLGLPEERTTVTKKVRRVGEWDPDLIRAAVAANGLNSRIAITMLDQKFGSVQGLDNTIDRRYIDFDLEVRDFLNNLEGIESGRIDLVTTGEDTGVWLR